MSITTYTIDAGKMVFMLLSIYFYSKKHINGYELVLFWFTMISLKWEFTKTRG